MTSRCFSCMSELTGPQCLNCGTTEGSQPDNPLNLPAGTTLNNRYLIGKVIGVGGFGVVYLGWDTNLDVRVAVKEFLPKDIAGRSNDHISIIPYSDGSNDMQYGIQKFMEEAKALAKFQDHPGIVKVNESFKANNTAYMVMQYLDGMTLKEYLKNQPGERITFDTAVKALTPIMDALREVHNAGFVHRDVSPDNIFITRQKQVKLLDFGAARYAMGEHSKSLTSVLKHGYAPVEQYSSKGNQGPWTDVYAVAATIYRCITGETPTDAMERIQAECIRTPRQMGIDISDQQECVLMKGLSLRPAERFESVSGFQNALKDGETISASENDKVSTDTFLIDCGSCGAANQLKRGDNPSALKCGKCGLPLAIVVPGGGLNDTDAPSSTSSVNFAKITEEIDASMSLSEQGITEALSMQSSHSNQTKYGRFKLISRILIILITLTGVAALLFTMNKHKGKEMWAGVTPEPTSRMETSRNKDVNVSPASDLPQEKSVIDIRGKDVSSWADTPDSRSSTEEISREEAEKFVNTYLEATSNKDTDAIMDLYDESVDYFAWGKVNKQSIRQDKANYFKRWNFVRSEMNHIASINDVGDSIIRVNFILDFTVMNSQKKISGKADDTVLLKKTQGKIKIIDEKQTVIERIKQ